MRRAWTPSASIRPTWVSWPASVAISAGTPFTSTSAGSTAAVTSWEIPSRNRATAARPTTGRNAARTRPPPSVTTTASAQSSASSPARSPPTAAASSRLGQVRLRPPAGPKPLTLPGQMGAGTAVELTAVVRGEIQRVGELGVAVAEHPAQHEHRPLGRAEPLQQQQDGKGHRLPLLHRLQRLRGPRTGQHRLRQPRPHVHLAASPRTGQPIHTQPRHHPHQARLGVADISRAAPAQVRILHRVLGVTRRAEHAVGDGEQATALGLVPRIRNRRPGHHHPHAAWWYPVADPEHCDRCFGYPPPGDGNPRTSRPAPMITLLRSAAPGRGDTDGPVLLGLAAVTSLFGCATTATSGSSPPVG